MKTHIFYRPKYYLIVCDIVFSVLATLLFFLLKKYDFCAFFARFGVDLLLLSALWLAVSYVCGKYRNFREMKYRPSVLRLFAATLIVLSVAVCLSKFGQIRLSILQLSLWQGCIFLADLLAIGLIHIVFYAIYLDEDPRVYSQREPVSLLGEPTNLGNEVLQARQRAIDAQTTPSVRKFISEKCDIGSSATLVCATSNLFNFRQLQGFHHDVILNIEKLNNIRGLNKMFCEINSKLPDFGRAIFCFESRSTRKRRFFATWPAPIAWVVYAGDFFVKRVVPKLFLTNRLYYDITQGRDRVLTKTEVFGRLYYCGFEVVEYAEIDGYTIVVARRASQPHRQVRRRYGLLIKLQRRGKNGQLIGVYKLRTMHPYAEYLQQYMYDNHHLQEGGKFANDIRVSTLGHLARRLWLDEFPMIINLLRGEMKLVGVRPLSRQYFSLYSLELQEKRTKFKPGLLPPFYADMPKTLNEIQASEMRYLRLCERRGCFVADNYYFWRIVYNILIKRARSN